MILVSLWLLDFVTLDFYMPHPWEYNYQVCFCNFISPKSPQFWLLWEKVSKCTLCFTITHVSKQQKRGDGSFWSPLLLQNILDCVCLCQCKVGDIVVAFPTKHRKSWKLGCIQWWCINCLTALLCKWGFSHFCLSNLQDTLLRSKI